jgi:hypothetical protein
MEPRMRGVMIAHRNHTGLPAGKEGIGKKRGKSILSLSLPSFLLRMP